MIVLLMSQRPIFIAVVLLLLLGWGSPVRAQGQAVQASEFQELQQLWGQYEKRLSREQLIANTEAFLQEYPDSYFAPELYYHMGTLYGSKRNTALGERPDASQITAYFKKAAEGYDWRFSRHSEAVYSTLINRDSAPFSEKVKYYDWIVRLRSGGYSDEEIYPFNHISLVLKGNAVEVDAQQAERMIPAYRNLFNSSLNVAAKNITLTTANPNELRQLIDRFPDTPLAVHAKQKLPRVLAVQDRHIKETLSADAFLSVEPDLIASNETNPDLGPSISTLGGNNEILASSEPGLPSDESGYLRATIWAIALLTLVGVSVVAIYRLRARRIEIN